MSFHNFLKETEKFRFRAYEWLRLLKVMKRANNIVNVAQIELY